MHRCPAFAPSRAHAGSQVFPVVSVTLAILLFLIFLVCTPVYSHHKPLLLPTVSSAPVYLDTGDLVVVSVQQDGSVFIDRRWYPPAELPAALAHVVRVVPSVTRTGLVLCVDRSLSFSSVRRLLRLVSAAGASRVILDVEPTAPYSSTSAT